MKIRKFDNRSSGRLCLAEMGALSNVIVALDKAQNSTATSLPDAKEFQERCATAIIALSGLLLEDIESHYAPETKRFRVTYDVKRSGVHAMEVDAETEEDARNLVQNKLSRMEPGEFDDMKTDFVAADVVEAEEVKDASQRSA